MRGVFPALGFGAVAIRDANGEPLAAPPEGAYVPGPDFTTSTIITALRTRCRQTELSPEQMNALVSELLALAEFMNPSGHWDAHDVRNLAAAWQMWMTRPGPGSLEERVSQLTASGITINQAQP